MNNIQTNPTHRVNLENPNSHATEAVAKNYNVFKKEMREFLKRPIPLDSQVLLNNQLKSVIETLQDMNQDVFDMDLQNKIGHMYKDFLPYMVGYWMINEVPDCRQPRLESSNSVYE